MLGINERLRWHHTMLKYSKHLLCTAQRHGREHKRRREGERERERGSQLCTGLAMPMK
jgi:hypothetical protein